MRPSISSNDTGERGNVRTALYDVSVEPKNSSIKIKTKLAYLGPMMTLCALELRFALNEGESRS